MQWAIILIGLFILYWSCFVYEGFAYASNPCASFDSCSSCAAAPGCGWCTDLRVCQPMAQDGFPIRTKDLTTGNPGMSRSPYLSEGVVPVITDCPPSCRATDLGDCECLAKDTYKNSCDPDCYATYGQEDLISGSGPLDIKRLNRTCICPKTYVGSDAIVPIGMEQAEIARLANAQAGINRLLKSTRIHVCSPHTFIVDSDRC